MKSSLISVFLIWLRWYAHVAGCIMRKAIYAYAVSLLADCIMGKRITVVHRIIEFCR